MKSFFRFLCRNRLYTFIEVAGMAVAICFILFIGSFVIGQFSTDTGIKRQGDIYAGHSERMFLQSATIKGQLEGKFPEILEMSRIIPLDRLSGFNAELRCGEVSERQNALLTDENFFEFFPFPLVAGSTESALSARNSIVISESCAARLFPDSDPMGQDIMISYNGKETPMYVSGVFSDFSDTILPSPEIIYRIDVAEQLFPSLTRNGNGTSVLFFRLAAGCDPEDLASRILETVAENDFVYSYGIFKEYRLCAFEDIRSLRLDVMEPFSGIADPDFVKIFIAAGILLLVFAVLNYISLTVAQTGFRAREMATRRLVGAQRSGIICRYIGESSVLTAASFLLALLISGLSAPAFSRLIGQEVDPLGDIGAVGIMLMVLLVLLLSVCAGTVPALIVSRWKPIDIVRGSFARMSRMTLGKAIICCQSVIALTTLSIAMVMSLQLRHLVERPMGYERDGRIYIGNARKAADYHVDELRSFAFVENTGWLQFPPAGSSMAGTSFTIDGAEVKLDCYWGDQEAFDILGFKVISRNSEPVNQSLWLTESAMRALGLGYDCQYVEFDNASFPVCGIIADWRKGSADGGGANGDFILVNWVSEMNSEADFMILRDLIVKVSGDENEAAGQIERFYRERGLDDIAVMTLNEMNRGLYNSLDRNLKLICLFTLLTLLLSALALVAMSTWHARQHAKETALRKVMGCTRGQIFCRTAAGFLRPVAVAAAIAIPLAWLLAGRWLDSFSWRIENALWVYLLAAMAVTLTAVLAISWQTVRLMGTNPAEALKNE